MEKTKFAIIGGSGFEKLFEDAERRYVVTPYGISIVYLKILDERPVVFISRHGVEHSIPPHKINNRANIWTLNEFGVERIIGVNAVGAINSELDRGDVVIPHDFIDFTRRSGPTFLSGEPVAHLDMSVPYCPEIRQVLFSSASKFGMRVYGKGVFLTTIGPRYETPAEIKMFRKLGCDIVGMTAAPEAILCRELGICYANFCFVSNMAAGLQKELSPRDVTEVSKKISPQVEQALIDALRALPLERKVCPCSNALEDARFI